VSPVIQKAARAIYSIYAVLVFVTLMVPVFIWAVLVSPFGSVRSGNLVYRACVIWGDIWFFLIGVPHRNLYEEPLSGEASIFVANHVSYFDIPVIVKTFRRPVRPLGKAEMTKVPVFGYIYKNAIVTVARNSPEDRARSVRLLKSILQQGISVLVFPEGTFNQTGQPLKDFYDGAFRIAIETGAPIRPVLMLDTFDRLDPRSIFSATPGRSRSVFLPAISTAGLTLNDLESLKLRVSGEMDRKLRAYDASWIKE
jgi:1-acyl-sn-glycerol-3-phosphate acyltransferase